MSKPFVKFKYSLVVLFSAGCLSAQEKEMRLSFEQALQRMHEDNKSLKIAEQEAKWARNEHQRLNSFWYPHLTATGAYVHLSNPVEVKESLSQFTDPVVDFIHSVLPGEELVSSVLNGLGKKSFSVPLFPQNVTSVDALVTWPLFTGGKRIYAGKIGKLMVDIAEINQEKTNAEQQILLVETYYGLRLGRKIIEVRTETYNAMERHFQNALKLEEKGMINKAERLYFQVNRDEAKRELEVARKDWTVLQNTLKTLVQIDSGDEIRPVSSLFIHESLPDLPFFKNLVSENNYLVSMLGVQHDIQNQQMKIAQSAYLPNIEVFGKQTLYAHGISKNLAPRTMWGVGFSWNLFDGLDREKKIGQAKINRFMIAAEKEKMTDDLMLAVDKFYNQIQSALENVTALKSTVAMSRELVRARRKAFAEGMATSTEVIDAELMLSKVRIATLLAYFEFDSGLIHLLSVCGIPDTFSRYSSTGKEETYVLKDEVPQTVQQPLQ